ncbi:MAG: prephenate dehydrogenase/arogenate dehydrogenase family protein [Gammaproteobacteria bacterium]
MSSVLHIERLAVIGVGLIGGSLALALRRAGVVGEVVGAGRGVANLERARERGIVDRFTTDPAAAVTRADMVVVGVTLGATRDVFARIAPALAPDAVVTDVGSTKASVVAAAHATLGAHLPNFVPGHPIAGTERSGADAAFAELYDDHKVVLTPLPETRAGACERVRAMWCAAGATVVEMDVATHDAVLARTSHLPHLLAYNLVDALAGGADADAVFEFAAGGFRDFTRIASSSPAMWADIVLANREALLAACGEYSARFDALVSALEAGDRDTLENAFTRAKTARDTCIVPESNEPR